MPPPIGNIKANCDAALAGDSSRGGLGLVLRDHTGSVRKAISIPTRLSSVIQDELLAIHNVLTVALDEGFSHLQVESDSNTAVGYILKHHSNPPSDVIDIISDVQWLSASFTSITFSYVPRAMNFVVDALARKALPLVYETVWP
ncbi:uncharacterized protein LOC122643578 [Telopea speciosissima]|uniref:uncharacterized protein LOC122643578 n=1 Tax=Telopea speciosissima TaxID=54955 RepID=UPI001CC4C9E6|nr:uncharacterized protein LOC122643578 [Telopea speciosissima]